MINNDIVIQILSYLDNINSYCVYHYSDSNSIGLGQYSAEDIKKHVIYCQDSGYLDKKSSSIIGNNDAGLLIYGLSSKGHRYLLDHQK